MPGGTCYTFYVQLCEQHVPSSFVKKKILYLTFMSRARPKAVLGLVVLGTLAICYAWFSTGLLYHQKVEVEVERPRLLPITEHGNEEGKEERAVYTEIECRLQGSYCVYSNLCFNGEDVSIPICLHDNDDDG